MELQTWIEDLIWCPSQCYYYFIDKYGRTWCIYLRWRWSDPWTASLVPIDEEGNFIYELEDNPWHQIELDRDYIASELKDLEEAVIEKATILANSI